MNICERFNGFNHREFLEKIHSKERRELFANCSIRNKKNLTKFREFILHNTETPPSDLARGLRKIKIMYKHDEKLKHEISKICILFIKNQIQNSANSTFSSRFKLARILIEKFVIRRNKYESDRLELAKNILTPHIEIDFFAAIKKVLTHIPLNDRSKLKMFEFCLHRFGIGNFFDRLVRVFEDQFKDKKYWINALEILDGFIEQHPDHPEADFFFKSTKINLYLSIFEHNPDFFLRWCNKNNDRDFVIQLVFDLLKTEANYQFFLENRPAMIIKCSYFYQLELSDDLNQRKILAEKCFNESRKVFSKYLLHLFTEDEILENASFFEPKIFACLSELPKKYRDYLVKIQMYLQRLQSKTLFDKDCHHWDCLGQPPQETGSWVFKLKWTYDVESNARSANQLLHRIDSDNVSIYPAIEPVLIFLIFEKYFNSLFFCELGFSYDSGPSGVFLSLPDVETLVSKWSEIRVKMNAETSSNLSLLSIGASDGTATTSEFLALLQRHDVVVSNNKEFVHDMCFHVYKTLIAMMQTFKDSVPENDYFKTQERMRAIGEKTLSSLNRAYTIYTSEEEIASLNLIREALGALYDSATTLSFNFERNSLFDHWESGKFLQSTFGCTGSKRDDIKHNSFLMYFWRTETIKRDIIRLGVPFETPRERLRESCLYEKLKEMWDKIFVETDLIHDFRR